MILVTCREVSGLLSPLAARSASGIGFGGATEQPPVPTVAPLLQNRVTALIGADHQETSGLRYASKPHGFAVDLDGSGLRVDGGWMWVFLQGRRFRGDPQPLDGHRLFVEADGHTVHATLNCGGTFRVAENASEVSVTYLAPRVSPGAGSCAMVRVLTMLSEPLAGRALVDGVDHARLNVFDLTALDRPASDVAAAFGGPSWSAGNTCPDSSRLVAEIPCGAQEYSVSGVAGQMTLVQDLADSDPPYSTNPVPTEETAPWCLQRGVPGVGKCGNVACQPVAGPTGFVVCNTPHGRFRRYVTWRRGDYRLYLASNQPVDAQILARAARTVA
jgi:hypothetical protein